MMRLFRRDQNKAKGYTIFVIEDDPVINELIVNVLQDEGFTVELAVSAEDALQKLNGDKMPNVFIVDFGLPQASGGEFIESARVRFGRLAFPPVLMITASREAETRAHQLQIEDFLPKPFNNDELVKHVWNLIEKNVDDK